uniref:Denticleless protein B n=1 Tax=Ascaris suum TaxID=6253 RepID=F1KYE9_ASCSU
MHTRRIRQGLRPPRVPECYFAQFCSQRAISLQVPFVCCRFSPELTNESLLALGNEAGVVFLADVRNISDDNNLFKKAVFVDVGCVLDMDFLRGRSSHLVVISGHSNVTLWDVEKGIDLLQFIGHEGSVRALAISKDSPDIFATGARDGTICIWDQREKPKRGMKVEPTSIVTSAHMARSSDVSLSASKRRTSLKTKMESKGITSLAFLDANTLISASTSCQTGVLFRDLRYWGSNLPVRTLTYPTSSAKRDFGVTSICLDRYRSSLFVSTTDSFIWEYAINSTKNSPIDVLRGVKRSSVCAFDMKLSASPISDHLTYGSGESQALLWDLQERNYSSRILNASRNEYYPYPKFTLGGHTTEVSIAQFSCSAQYIVSMDDTTWRLWQLDTSFVEKIASKPIGFEQIEFYSFPFSQRTSSQLERLSVTSGNSPSTKRKTPLTSPFESPFKSNSTAYPMNVHRSPAKKSSKLSSSPFSPLPNICNVEIVKHSRQLRSARRLDFSPEKVFSFENTDFDSGNAELPKCAFHFKYPTQNLPDWVKERHRAKAEQQLQQQSPSTSSQKMFANIRDYFNPPSPSVSNCSRMLSQAERELQRSPRKLLLKQRLRESAERAQKVAKLATPRRSRAATRRVPLSRCSNVKTPISITNGTTQKMTDSSSSVTPVLRRTLEDFFRKKS